MGKCQLIGAMAYIDGWKEVARLVEKNMSEWGPELSDWTVKIRVFTDKDAQKADQGDEDAYRTIDEKNKILVVAYTPESVIDPEVEADLLMEEFVEVELDTEGS